MSTNKPDKNFAEILQEKFKKEMPRIRKEIKVYEDRLKKGTLNSNPTVAPQFKKEG